ncbi:MAG TPA: glycosyltransferase family 4 protein, partial [Thermoanaerobaculia bacterium]|nr:glycosyltransferase family 4 protein [Thermoanaerobaculia bacterium]
RRAAAPRRLRIVALNWRDPGHPEAGGAELHLFEILRRCVRDGDRVTWLAEAFPGAAPEDAREGIEIVRAGTWYNAHLALGALYRARFRRERVDLVVEDINKVPFFTPLFSRAPVLAVVPHLFGATVFREASPLVGAVVWAHEALVPLVYRRTPFLAISESTRDDLVRRGIDRARIDVVRCGLDPSAYAVTKPPEAREPVVSFLGRLRKYKGAQYVLRAFPAILAAAPEARLEIVGDGPYRAELERLAGALGVAGRVRFLGALAHEAKVAVLNEAQVATCPSPKEGWGLTVIEANACGAPVVASRSPGLVESVRDGETGLLVPHGDVAALAEGVIRLLRDRAERLRMAEAGRRWAATFDWETCYRESRASFARAAAAGGRA